jgi:hypothetical protein
MSAFKKWHSRGKKKIDDGSTVVKIRWGSAQFRSEYYEDQEEYTEYRFKTDEEALAFWTGVQSAIGWSDFEEVK